MYECLIHEVCITTVACSSRALSFATLLPSAALFSLLLLGARRDLRRLSVDATWRLSTTQRQFPASHRCAGRGVDQLLWPTLCQRLFLWTTECLCDE